jgi:predicted transposase/invertase (TIGR01784 family)
MRTDTIFYQIFLTFNSLLFELIGEPEENADGYKFTSVEVKEKAFRFDGIFMPDCKDKSIYFAEVQFQPNSGFYWEFIAEINIYLNQYKPIQDWQGVAIFANRSLEPETLSTYQQELIEGDRIIRIYLEELPSGSIGIDLINLIVSKELQAPKLAKQLMQRTAEIDDNMIRQRIVELLLECLVSKFSKLSRQEIEAMFLVSDIKQTRFYQDVKQEGKLEGKQEGHQEGRQEGRQEGKQDGEKALVLRQLIKRFGKLSDRHQTQISALEIFQLEELAEALLDFTNITDLNLWLENVIPSDREISNLLAFSGLNPFDSILNHEDPR